MPTPLASRAALPALAVLLLLTAAPARACNVPVFRYALEKWQADAFEVIVFHSGPLSPAHKTLADALDRHANADPGFVNFDFTLVDLARKPDPDLLKVFESQRTRDLPLLVVRYPEVADLSATWSAPLTADSVRQLLDSPARRELVRRLVSGDSAVWVLLEGGDRAKDAAAEKLLRSELQKLQKTLKLPRLTADPEDAISSKGPELKLAFSLLRVSRDDPAEKMLVWLLQHIEPDLLDAKYRGEPMAFAVFGRGRALPPLVGRGITPRNIAKEAEFLTGPCTCKVKEQNPGVDLLIVADWTEPADRQPTPDLPREGGRALPPAPTPPSETQTEPAAETGSSPVLVRNVLLAVAGGLALAGALTFLLSWKNRG
jgi:hypothetical protein